MLIAHKLADMGRCQLTKYRISRQGSFKSATPLASEPKLFEERICMEERAFKGVWIPSEIWLNKELTIYEKAIFAEIDSLDGEKHCWASNEYLAEFCQMSVPTISRAINKLIEMGFIEKVSFDGRQRVLKVSEQSRLISEISLPNQTDDADLSPSEFLLIKENKKENIEEAPAPQAPSSKINPKRNFRAEHEQLEDILESGKEIDMQTKERKKLSEFEKCLAEIDKRNFSAEEKDLLRIHLDKSYHSKDPKRIKDRSNYVNKLNMLEQLIKKGNNGLKVIQQSIDRQWSAFYEYSEKQTTQQHEPLADKVVSRSAEEAQKDLDAKKADPNQKWY